MHRVSVGKPEAKMTLGRPRYRWEDNITSLQEVGRGTSTRLMRPRIAI
jgi:hypothetical protein